MVKLNNNYSILFNKKDEIIYKMDKVRHQRIDTKTNINITQEQCNSNKRDVVKKMKSEID